ncbi:MAG: hypothetical protein PHG67_10515 [Bacteroidales bacterium]|nr:hypothetical protein [Bacteroidales bacterium]
MTSSVVPLEYGRFYHIYNRGINGCNLFQENENYDYFMRLYGKYISLVADTFAWVLMRNHFHFLVRIKNEEEISFMGNHQTPEGFENTSGSVINLSVSDRPESVSNPKRLIKKYKPVNQFSYLFNAYTKAINKRYHRTGSLFEHPFRRIQITSKDQLLYMIYYIHHNPIHHGFCKHFLEYPWSSYLTILSPEKTNLKRDEVLRWFYDKAYFKEFHCKEQIEKYDELQINSIFDF